VDLSDQERFVTPPTDEIFDRVLDNARRRSTLRAAFSARGTKLVNTYQHGPYKIVALFVVDTNSYWEVKAQASRDVPWTQDALDVWLCEELVRQLDVWCAARVESP
jgi:hypothetical protein